MDLDKLAAAVREAITFGNSNVGDVEKRAFMFAGFGVLLGAIEKQWPEVTQERITAMLRRSEVN